MSNKQHSVYSSQLRAMLKRNILLKKREKRKTIAEVLLPLYSLSILIIIKITLPNPNLPKIDVPRGKAELLENFGKWQSPTVAVVPNSTEIPEFLENIDSLWHLSRPENAHINWLIFDTEEDLTAAYWKASENIPIAVLFEDPNPISGPLRYEIRTNPSLHGIPATSGLFSSPLTCRDDPKKQKQKKKKKSEWYAGVLPAIEGGHTCPVNQYYFSGFLALQALLDYTKIGMESKMTGVKVPQVLLEMFPKEAHTGNWMVIIRSVVPIYMVMALSQFITYLLIIIVGEKENKIKEGMKIMGLRDSVFWSSWFIIYGTFVLFLSIVCSVLLFALKVFVHSSFVLIFAMVLLYCLTIIMFGFMITPFFDKASTAGVLSNFAVTIMSLFYYIQVFLHDSHPLALWALSLISPSGFALAMDNALVTDLSGEGVNFDNLWSGSTGMPFGGSLVMLALDLVLYASLAYYLDSVVPGEHGVKKSPLFCFQPSFCWPKNDVQKVTTAVDGSSHSSNNCDGTLDVEPVSRELRGREAIRIVDLYKSFHDCRKPETKAINGINLTIYEGQITAILGHNGAGKTTLFNILTGLTAPTAGTAFIFGHDVRDPNGMDQIRRMTGVCPQHDILFDNLSPREHLEFFAAVKGIHPSDVESEVSKTLRDIDLTDKADASAKHLSGGQKRKLSVGIALIGDPKIIILDEPTAGVDPYSRRHMWSVLRNRRHGRVILLTTHFMDEADILTDRKAVVSKGCIRCCGSSLFLKNKFGIGYHLTLVLEGVCREHAISRLVKTHVPKAEKARRHGRELSFILPHNAVEMFAPLFSAIEQEIRNKSSKLGISSYGVSMTTLEEVFLHLEKDEEPIEVVDNLSKRIVRNRALSRSLSLQSKSNSYHSMQNESSHFHCEDGAEGGDSSTLTAGGLEAISETKSPPSAVEQVAAVEHSSGVATARTFLALARLRALRLARDPQKLYLMVLLPLVVAASGLYFNSRTGGRPRPAAPTPPLSLDAAAYGGAAFALRSGATAGRWRDALAALGVRPLTAFQGNFSALLQEQPRMAALDIYDEDDMDFHLRGSRRSRRRRRRRRRYPVLPAAITVLYNDTQQHSLPIILNIIDNAIYRMAYEESRTEEDGGNNETAWRTIVARARSFPQIGEPDFDFGSYTATFTMGMIFALLPVSFAVDMVYDREIKAKNQLRVNGLSFSMYLSTYLAVLAAVMALICAALVGVMMAFETAALTTAPALLILGLLLLLYSPASVLFAACVSYVFDEAENAQAVLPNVATFYGCVPFAVVAFVGAKTSFALHVIFSFSNPMYLPYGIVHYVQKVFILCQPHFGCGKLTLGHYLTDEIVIMLVALLLHLPFWFLMLLIVDVRKSGGTLKDLFETNKKKGDADDDEEADHSNYVGENEDRDVQAERRKVNNLMHCQMAHPPVVMVQNLHKEYVKQRSGCGCDEADDGDTTTKVAVKSLSLAVDAGEVFGLLGHNGAGKTTAMKIMTAEEAPTAGQVRIGGECVTSNASRAFRLMGYCPQHDALWGNITVREHLECYAALRGVPRRALRPVVDAYLDGLQIRDNADKQARHCSGGTRRKLSFAMATVGARAPDVVLLDEPSAGMDPRSKRFLWDTILATFRGARGAILTTHSMEEADALCSRVAIMVKGELRCLGSTQHLKNLYGAGYTLEMKVCCGGGGGGEAEDARNHARLTEFVFALFPDATVAESFADRLVFSVPQHGVPSLASCFSQLEKAKIEMDIEEYSFSQTTLEQVFLKFAHEDEVNGE